MRYYFRLLTFVLSTLFTLLAQAKPNACGVTAGFTTTPVEINLDGKLYTFYSIQNTSIGATNVLYKFNDGIFQEFYGQMHFLAGPNVITQIASNGDCKDTMVYVLFVPGKMPEGKPNVTAHIGHRENYYLGHSITTTANEQLIISSKEFDNFVPYPNLLLMDRFGCIKKSFSGNDAMMWEAMFSDGNGSNMLPFYATRTGSTGIMRISDDLDIQWAKLFRSSRGLVSPKLIANLNGGEFVSLSDVPAAAGAIPEQLLVRHQANGEAIWAKQLSFPGYDFSYSTNMAVIGNRLFIHVQNSIYIIDHFEIEEQIIAVDLLSGNIIWQKRIGAADHMFWINDLAAQNGKLLLTGYWDDPQRDPKAFTTIIQMDVDGNIERAADLLNTDYHNLTPGGTYKIKDIDGQHFYLQLYGFIGSSVNVSLYYSVIVKMNPDWSMAWKKIRAERGLGPIGFGTVLNDGAFATIGSSWGGNMIPQRYSYNMHYQVFDKEFTQDSVLCEFGDIEMSTKPVTAMPVFSLPASPSIDEQIYTKDTSISTAPLDMTIRYTDKLCAEYLDSCNMIRISGPEKICSLQDTYTFTAWRNPACTQAISWELPPTATLVQQTGNTIKIRFSGQPEGFIKAYIANSCISVRDSLRVKMSDGIIGPFNLGNDTSICPNSEFDLTARQGYEMYGWSTGSNANYIRVNSPGKYWVQVQDACGNIFSDTILVTEKLKELINAGPDIDLCPGTPAEIIAPTGYDAYQWSNDQQQLISSAPKLSLLTGLPGRYFLEAKVIGGCIAYDTVVVTNKIAPSLTLGADTSICQESSLQFDAGNGFQSYQWSTGQSSQKITVSNPGKYTVLVTATNGCIAEASRQLLNVFELPEINLDKSDYLCKGASRTLEAGNGYSQYNWQDGSNKTTYTVNGTGRFWVSVTDINQCIGSDTVDIQRIIDPPANYLDADATICFYGEKTLKATTTFSAYTWSTGEQTASILAKKPGLYWLQATDATGCVGRDSIQLTGIECMVGIHFPNAFSPNGDGRNDILKPLLYSAVEQYEFSVFNRFGQLVFSSKDPQKGWDGMLQGKIQDQNSFIWSCTYKIVGQPLKKEKGIVVLIR